VEFKASDNVTIRGWLIPGSLNNLICSGTKRSLTELADIQSFYENTPEPKEFYWIENTKHRFESYSYFQDNPEKMLDWLERWM